MAKLRKPKKPKPSKWSWILSSDGVKCFKDRKGGQTIIGALWEAEQLTAWHDEPLAKATKQINEILRAVEVTNGDPRRRLGFIEIRNRQMLVWAAYDVVGPDDDDEEIARALGLPAIEDDEEPSVGYGSAES